MDSFEKFVSILVILCLNSSLKAENKPDFLCSQSVRIDAYLPTLQIIRRHGYPAELHKFQSEDGYILGYHRIPHGKNGVSNKKPYPIILHHGLLSSSVDWIINGPKKSLAYILADEGFDVWLANARGSTDSKAHISLKPVERKFWNFTFHEMGKYDVPAAIDYILNTTNKEKLIYIGHSQGTTIFYVFAITRPEMSNKVLLHISIAPVAMIPHTTSLFKCFIPWMKQLQTSGQWYRIGSFLEHSPQVASVTKFFCGQSRHNVCDQFAPLITGRDDEQFQKEVFSIFLGKLPSGTSTKNMVHSSQLISPGKFEQFDYGKFENLKIYGQVRPPKYDFQKINIPIRLYYGDNDLISNPTDTRLLYKKLPKPIGCISVPYKKWNHVDFLWARDVNELFNAELLQFLQNVTKNENYIEKSKPRGTFQLRRAH